MVDIDQIENFIKRNIANMREQTVFALKEFWRGVNMDLNFWA